MTKYSKEEKIAAIKAVEAGESYSEVCKRYQISDSLLYWIVRNYREHGEQGLSSHAYGWTVAQKYEVLKYKHKNQLPFTEAGILFGINDHTIWDWEKRYLENGIEGLESKRKGKKPRTPKPKPPKTREEELLEKIQDQQMEIEYLKKLNALVAEREKREKGIK